MLISFHRGPSLGLSSQNPYPIASHIYYDLPHFAISSLEIDMSVLLRQYNHPINHVDHENSESGEVIPKA